jgi:hypothetical protein
MAAERQESEVPGIDLDFMEWRLELLPGVSVELVEIAPGVDLSELFIKPGTMLELDDIDFLESKIAL